MVKYKHKKYTCITYTTQGFQQQKKRKNVDQEERRRDEVDAQRYSTVLSLISLQKREEFHSPSLLKSNCTGMCNVMSVYNNSPCQYLILNFEEGKWSLSSNRYCSLFVPLTFLTLYLFLPLRASLMREQYFLLSLFHKTVSQCLNQQLISWVKEKKMWVQHVNV